MRLFLFALLALSIPFLASAQEGFALLTGEDGPFSNAASASDLPVFLNQIYLLCIGIAVVVSILQIIRGGITWMLTDSVMEKGQARHLVTIAIMGLLLVLSPVIVFNIINPCILSLSLSGTEECEGSLGDLKPSPVPNPETDPVPEEGRMIANGQYIKAYEYPNTTAGLALAAQYEISTCSGFSVTKKTVGDKYLVVCMKVVGLGVYMDVVPGVSGSDSSPDIDISNSADTVKNAEMKSDCAKLRSYGYTYPGLNKYNQDRVYAGKIAYGPGVDEASCAVDDNYHDRAFTAPLAPGKGARICNYFESDSWCGT